MKKNIALIALISTAIAAPPATAFQSVFDNAKNLRVLKTLSAAELRETMRGFSFALGVRCTHCHVRETPEGSERPVMIFDRDDKENKLIARKMLTMVADINAKITGLGRGENHIYQPVTCTTCHRGQNKPILIQTVLDAALKKGGAEEAISQYIELKERYYGGHTYDFTPFTFAEYAQTIASGGDLENGAILAAYNTKSHPNEAYGQQILGQINLAREDYIGAIAAFEAANKIRPTRFIQGLLKKAQDAEAAAKNKKPGDD